MSANPDILACPLGLDERQLRDAVIAMYEQVARAPRPGDFHFHVGPGYAIQRLGYDADALAALPPTCSARFAGVGNPLLAARPRAGEVVLDHACGAGTDLLLAARHLGTDGRAIGIDLTPGMRDAAQRAAHEAGLAARVEIRAGSFDALPQGDASVDLLLSNGVLNLAPDKRAVLREAWRVLRPGATLALADVVLGRPLAESARAQAALWAACVGGALTEPALHEAIRAAGFEAPEVVARHDPFAGTSLPLKFGAGLAVTSLTLRARKPR